MLRKPSRYRLLPNQARDMAYHHAIHLSNSIDHIVTTLGLRICVLGPSSCRERLLSAIHVTRGSSRQYYAALRTGGLAQALSVRVPDAFIEGIAAMGREYLSFGPAHHRGEQLKRSAWSAHHRRRRRSAGKLTYMAVVRGGPRFFLHGHGGACDVAMKPLPRDVLRPFKRIVLALSVRPKTPREVTVLVHDLHRTPRLLQ